MFGEVYLVSRRHLADPEVAAGVESLEVGFLGADEVPWNSLAFPMVREALTSWTRESGGPARGVQTADLFWGPEGATRK